MIVRVLAAAALFMCVFVMPGHAQSLDQARAQTDEFMELLVSRDADALITVANESEFFEHVAVKDWDSTVGQMMVALLLAGEGGEEYEIIQTRSMGSKIGVIRYLVPFDSAPMLTEFVVYRPKSSWQLMNFDLKLGSEAIPLLKLWLGGSDGN